MLQRPAAWFRNVALAAGVLALLMVGAMEGLQEMQLSLWLHIPLTLIVLTLIAVGAMVSGAAYLEYQAHK